MSVSDSMTRFQVYAAGFSPAAKFNDLFIATGAVDRIRQVDSDRDLDQFLDPLAYYLCQSELLVGGCRHGRD